MVNGVTDPRRKEEEEEDRRRSQKLTFNFSADVGQTSNFA
jgi:hypothetical protein